MFKIFMPAIVMIISVCLLMPNKEKFHKQIDMQAVIQQTTIVPPSFEDIIQSIDEKTVDAAHNKDIMCLAKDIFYEARNQSTIGKIAVAYVPINRAAAISKSLCSVVYKKTRHVCQFTWVCKRKSNTKDEAAAWQASLKVAYATYNRLVADPTDGAKFYYNPHKAHPRWAKFKNVAQSLYTVNGFIGDHVFLKD